ncbi:MAG: aminoglycoside phosphotransferase family protein [Betaproteobacteria bacterium]
MNASEDPRRALAEDWLTQQATALAGLGWSVDPASLTAASSDASFRRYFRINGQRGGQSQCLILMDAPPEKESIGPFIKIATLLRQAGVNAPNIWRHDAGQGFLLCDDFGVTTYASAIERRQHDAAACAPLYRDAHQALVRLQRFSLQQPSASEVAGLVAYDRNKMLQEMQLFDQWFLVHHRPITLAASDREMLVNTYDLILDACQAQPVTLVHRDYHSRNLMLTEHSNPGILDFQDAVLGPISYDLVSLLRDAYMEWPEEIQLDWAIDYWEQARKAELPIAQDFSDFWRDFEWMGLQRQLKILGIFCRLNVRDGKPNYLNDIPRVLRAAISTCRRYQGLGPLAKLLERCV